MFHFGMRHGREHRFHRRGWGRLFGHHGPLGHHGHGMRGGRMLDHGDLRFITLQLLAERPRHGYEIIKAIEEKFGGLYSPSPGVVYPTLTHLEEIGLASVEPSQGNKKLYSITADGTAFLEQNRPLLTHIQERVEAASRAFGGGPSPRVVRAMENLRAALKIRLTQGALTDEQIDRVTLILDEAARRIEQA